VPIGVGTPRCLTANETDRRGNLRQDAHLAEWMEKTALDRQSDGLLNEHLKNRVLTFPPVISMVIGSTILRV